MFTSAWCADESGQRFSPLDRNLDVDAAVIGGGITGATTAYLLTRAGLSVALLDRARCGHGDTCHTTAHITYVTDKRLLQLVDQFGEASARTVWSAGLAAIEQINEIVQRESIACDFAWLPGHLHAAWDSKDIAAEAELLKRDAELANRLGFAAKYSPRLVMSQRPAVTFPNQALFHPLKYVSGLLAAVAEVGGHVFEMTDVEEVTPTEIRAQGHTIHCPKIVIATHAPVRGRASRTASDVLQSRLAAFNSYAIAASIDAGAATPGLYWDTSQPYYYLRVEDRGDYLAAILGGKDHKTGQCPDTVEPFRNLARRLLSLFPGAEITSHWSGQVIQTNDGLPLVGETAEGQFTATGFAGNGMTFSTVAAIMARDWATGRPNAWTELFSPGRVQLRGGTWRMIKENIDYPRLMIVDRLRSSEVESFDDVPRGEGRIMRIDGEHVAVYRDEHGHATACSAVCSHMGCIVHWNNAEQTWDCPCHGSRYLPNGDVIAGPATEPLAKVNAVEAKSATTSDD